MISILQLSQTMDMFREHNGRIWSTFEVVPRTDTTENEGKQDDAQEQPTEQETKQDSDEK
jgi:hypothetical protein